MFQFIKKLLGPRVDFKELLLNGGQIIDVRTKSEYQNGHLANSINIPLDTLANKLSKLDKTKPIITCCASGMRSASAKGILKSKGFTEVYNGGSWMSVQKRL